MNIKYDELRRKLDLIGFDMLEIYSEVVDAYHKGQIDCSEYMDLYDIMKDSGGGTHNIVGVQAG